jgi:hypothetical protein
VLANQSVASDTSKIKIALIMVGECVYVVAGRDKSLSWFMGVQVVALSWLFKISGAVVPLRANESTREGVYAAAN